MSEEKKFALSDDEAALLREVRSKQPLEATPQEQALILRRREERLQQQVKQAEPPQEPSIEEIVPGLPTERREIILRHLAKLAAG